MVLARIRMSDSYVLKIGGGERRELYADVD